MSKTNTNISGQDWHMYRRACERLRRLYSWNQLSKALGHSERGFAQAAYDTKHVCNIDTVQETQDLLRHHIQEGDLPMAKEATTSNGNGHAPALKGTLTKKAKGFIAAVDELRDVYLAEWDEIHEALGTTGPYQTYNVLKNRERTEVQKSTVQAVQDLVGVCRAGEAPWQAVQVAGKPGVRNIVQFVAACDELRETHGVEWPALEEAIDLVVHTSYYEVKGGKDRNVRNSTLRKVLEQLELARRGQAPWQDAPVAEEPDTTEQPEGDQPAQEHTVDLADAGVPASMDEVRRAVLELGAVVDRRMNNIIKGLEALRDASPKMMRVAYDREIENLLVASDTVASLLDDFES